MEFYKTSEMKGTMHMNKNGKIHARVLSFALSLSITMLNLPIHQVVHAADDTTIPEPLTAAFSIPIYIEPFHTEKYHAIDFEEYVDSEKIMDALCSCILSSRASLWTKLTLYDNTDQSLEERRKAHKEKGTDVDHLYRCGCIQKDRTVYIP